MARRDGMNRQAEAKRRTSGGHFFGHDVSCARSRVIGVPVALAQRGGPGGEKSAQRWFHTIPVRHRSSEQKQDAWVFRQPKTGRREAQSGTAGCQQRQSSGWQIRLDQELSKGALTDCPTGPKRSEPRHSRVRHPRFRAPFAPAGTGSEWPAVMLFQCSSERWHGFASPAQQRPEALQDKMTTASCQTAFRFIRKTNAATSPRAERRGGTRAYR
jgi:hypothetical protein